MHNQREELSSRHADYYNPLTTSMSPVLNVFMTGKYQLVCKLHSFYHAVALAGQDMTKKQP